MANAGKRVFENVLGDFFVNSTCIGCDACRQIAPSVFSQAAKTPHGIEAESPVIMLLTPLKYDASQ